MTLRPRILLRQEKGQLKGLAVTGKTGKPWVAVLGFDPARQPVTITVT
jgi:hypothetical protein